MRVEVIRAWPGRHESVLLSLADGATAEDALRESGFGAADAPALAVHGERVAPATPLHDGDRLEVLRPLQADPKDARRRRARASAPSEARG